jgi:hypothetical protein
MNRKHSKDFLITFWSVWLLALACIAAAAGRVEDFAQIFTGLMVMLAAIHTIIYVLKWEPKK